MRVGHVGLGYPLSRPVGLSNPSESTPARTGLFPQESSRRSA